MKQININDYVIVSDFDGTITKEDSNYTLVTVLGNDENTQIEADFFAGKLSNKRAFERHFEVMSISLAEYENFIKTNINIDDGFDRFLEFTHTRSITLIVVSAGFRQGIECVLGEKRLRGVEVFANDLSGAPYISPTFASKEPDCNKSFGPCGHCKRECITAIRNKTNRKIIFIGDGITDRCAVENADIIYAKHTLAEQCDAQGIAYIPYDTFDDITNHMTQLITE